MPISTSDNTLELAGTIPLNHVEVSVTGSLTVATNGKTATVVRLDKTPAAMGTVTLTLPAAAAANIGVSFHFYIIPGVQGVGAGSPGDPIQLQIKPVAADGIDFLAVAVNKKVELNTGLDGDFITLVSTGSTGAGAYTVSHVHGNWTKEA